MKKMLSIYMALERDLIVGGQAVMEGVMMRTPSAFAVAVRRRDGSIAFTSEALPKLTDQYPLLKLPILRGGATLIHSMALGIRALNFSANVAREDAEVEKERVAVSASDPQFALAKGGGDYENFRKAPVKVVMPESAKSAQPKQSAGIIGSMLFALGFNILLFIVAPLILTNVLFVAFGWAAAPNFAANASWLQIAYDYLFLIKPNSWLAFNFVDGLVRLTFFIGMIYSLSRSAEIRRVFEYHGAEHKTVFAWEHKLDLTVKNAQIQRRQHPRCGTSFLLVVMFVAIVLFSVINFDALLLNLLVRILLLPVVAGISYEIIRYAAKKEAGIMFKAMTMPGLWLQNLTTREPDASQLEVAIAALQESLKLEPKSV